MNTRFSNFGGRVKGAHPRQREAVTLVAGLGLLNRLGNGQASGEGRGVNPLQLENVERLNPVDPDLLPPTLPEVSSVTDPIVGEMQEEAVNWSFRTAAAGQLIDEWVNTAPADMGLNKGIVCSGIGLSANNGPTVYRVERAVGARPSRQQPRVWRFEDGNRTQVGRVTGPGRMNGDFGYTTDFKAIVGTLASFSHNFVMTLLGYWNRASLPWEGSWALPNLVLPETREPEQFHPDAGFTYRTRPAFGTNFIIVMQTPTPATVAFDVRTMDGSSSWRHSGVDVPQGESQVVMRTPGAAPRRGVFNVVPLDAPEGLTVTSVRTQPISF